MTRSVLQRQLRRLGLTEDQPPEASAWARFLDTVSSTYAGQEQDRYLLERAMTLSSDEMRVLHDRLHQGRERLKAVIDSLDVGLIVLGSDLRVELANPEAARILGASGAEILTWTLDDLLRCGKDDDRVLALLEGLITRDGDPPAPGHCHDARVRSAEGAVVPVSASTVPVRHLGTAHGAVVVLRDLSDVHRLELELRQAQKLEAVGRLAAGIAHELNTPIQFIGDNLRFIQTCLTDLFEAARLGGGTALLSSADDALGDLATAAGGPDAAAAVRSPHPDDLDYVVQELPEALSQSLEGVERVTSIVRAMRSFAHTGVTTPAPADINQALRDTVTMARNEVKGVADVVLRLGELPAVECLIHDLKQIFLNLVVNAAHAITDRQRSRPGRGLITVTTALDGDHVLVEVGDDGCGMSDEVAEHVFEPFFTTREVGRGCGQGLALARSVVVDGHHGTISLESEPRCGTVLRIRIPVGDRGDPAT